MSGVQSKGAVLNLEEAKVDDLKRIIAIQYREILVKNERLKGLEDLTRICSELEEMRQSWQTRANNYETALRRAEARIAYLNKKFGISPQAVTQNEEREFQEIQVEIENEIEIANENKAKAESALSEAVKCAADLQKMKQKSEEEISSLRRINENLRARDAEKEAMMVTMKYALESYEDDFRFENEEKVSIQRRLETAQQDNERLRRENQSYMTTIRHLQNEIERISESNCNPMRLPMQDQAGSG